MSDWPDPRRRTLRVGLIWTIVAASVIVGLALGGAVMWGIWKLQPPAPVPTVTATVEQTVMATETVSSTVTVAVTITASPSVALYPADAAAFGGHHYLLVTQGGATWDQANTHCKEMGAYLAHISSLGENNFLYSYIGTLGAKSAYFGFYKTADGTWAWSDGQPNDFTNWASGEPNNEGGREGYAEFYYKYTDGKWNDGDFSAGTTVSDTRAFICEWSE